MKKLLLILLLISSAAITCLAQTPSKSQWELFGGYSFMRANVRQYYKSDASTYAIRNRDANMNGWNVSITENVKSWFGGTLDASGHYKSPVFSDTTTRERAYSLLYGPNFFHQWRKLRPFGHVLLGVTHISAAVPSSGPSISATSFAAAPGGGLDFRLSKNVAIRLLQAEYFRSNLEGGSRNQLRASTGMVFDFSKK